MLHSRSNCAPGGARSRLVRVAALTGRSTSRQQPRQARFVATCASNYYEVLGVEPDASVDDIKQAFRRKAREMHPDVNREDGADQAFMECKEAYETLTDDMRRREYDRINRLGRRVGFFQDVDEPEVRSSPFRWSQVGYDPDPWPRRPNRSWEEQQEDDEDEEEGDEEGDGAGPSRQRGAGGEGEGDEDERLKQLWQFMERAGGPGNIRHWYSGGNPFGTSTSDMWRRQVDQQTQNPFAGRGGSWRGGGLGNSPNLPGGTEWIPPGRRAGSDWEDDVATKREGWRPPGREEWQPRSRPEDEDSRDRRGGGGGSGRRGWGDDGGFRGKPL